MKAIVDCNSFYCACERLFRPDLAHKPIIVLSNNDGCIISRSDEAKALGIKMAGPYYKIRSSIRKDTAVFSSNYNLYGGLSRRVMQTLKEYVGDNNVEVYSVDESFVDLSHIPSDQLQNFCLDLKYTVEKWTGIPVSIGVAKSKVLCKAANRISKKKKIETNGVVVLQSEDTIKEALEKMKVSDVWGIGQRFAIKLEEYGVSTAWDLRNMNEEWGRRNLGGVVGVRLIRELNGVPCIGLKDELLVKKMIATTRMFSSPVKTLRELKEAVSSYVSRAGEKLRKQKYCAKQMHVFVITNDYKNAYEYTPQNFGLSSTLPVATASTTELISYALPLVRRLFSEGSRYLKAGVILSELVPESSIQGSFFSSHTTSQYNSLMETIDSINAGIGGEALKFASSGLDRKWKMRQGMRSPLYTSRWNELKEVK